MDYYVPEVQQKQLDTSAPAAECSEILRRRRAELGPALPRVGLFLFDSVSAEQLRKTLECIPEAARDWIEEIAIFPDRASEKELSRAWGTLSGLCAGRLQIHRSAGDHGYGGARKAAFDYALRSGLQFAIVMRSDGRHPPEVLPQLLHAAMIEGDELVIAARRRFRGSRQRGSSLLLDLAQAAACWLQNRILGIRRRDHASGYRLYSVRALAAIPFQLAHDDHSFDVDLTIQHRALGLSGAEVATCSDWREGDTSGGEALDALRACARAVEYRLHQLHFVRRGRYFVDRGVDYTLKESPTGSHMQILAAIRPGSRVLDLGCSQGLLARPLREKQVQVVGVDQGPPEHLAEELQVYYQRDLEQPLELPVGRDFDYVVVADVIEHVRAPSQLLQSARRYLRPDGRLIISTPNIALWFYRLSLLVGRFEYGPRGVLDRTHVHLYTRDSFRREVQGAGFHILAERATALPFEVVFESTGRSRLMRGAAHLYHRLARLWPEFFAYQHILEAEIRILDDEVVTAQRGADDDR